jgi:hypothetical protein
MKKYGTFGRKIIQAKAQKQNKNHIKKKRFRPKISGYFANKNK